TDRSMFRETITSTMPVAMMAMDALWTDRFHRLRGVRKRPPDRTWKPSQMSNSAMIMPTRRVSSSSDCNSERTLRSDLGGRSVWVSRESVTSVTRFDLGSSRYEQTATVPAGTPWHSAALVIQPASSTMFRLLTLIGWGWSRIALTLLPPGVWNMPTL